MSAFKTTLADQVRHLISYKPAGEKFTTLTIAAELKTTNFGAVSGALHSLRQKGFVLNVGKDGNSFIYTPSETPLATALSNDERVRLLAISEQLLEIASALADMRRVT
jgi:hypothetical protein